MSIVANSLELIRTVFNRQTVFPQQYQMGYWQSQYGVPYDPLRGTTDPSIHSGSQYTSQFQEQMRINQDLIYKLADYEEMAEYPEIGMAYKIYADEATQQDPIIGKTVWAESADETVESIINYTLHNNLQIENDLWDMAWELAQSGNLYEELITIDGYGVLKINNIKPLEIRRVQDEDGVLYGFLQDRNLSFTAVSTKDFLQRLNEGNKGNDSVKVYEPWEVAHFRFGAGRQKLYGECLHKDTRILTDKGIKKIEQITSEDMVVTWDFKLKKQVWSKVKSLIPNGEKRYKIIKTKTRTIKATDNHPLLTSNGWKQVEECSVGDKLKIISRIEEGNEDFSFVEKIKDEILNIDCYVKIVGKTLEESLSKRKATGLIKERDSYGKIVSFGENLDSRIDSIRNELMSISNLNNFLSGKIGLKKSYADYILSLCNISVKEYERTYNREAKDFSLDFNFEEFAEFFGFMLGNGWLTTNGIAFAVKDSEEINDRIYSLAERFRLNLIPGFTGKRLSYYSINNLNLKELFNRLDFIQGSGNKRIPGWVFQSNVKIRDSFLTGILSANGWQTFQAKNPYWHIELANEELINDVKTLAESIGYRVGSVRNREARIRHFETGKSYCKETCLLYINKNNKKVIEESIISIEEGEIESVYDIEVDHPDHNFIAEGLVVHNSIAEPARWAWKRLSLMEDAMVLYKLTRAPQRYVFYTDIGDKPPNAARAVLERVKDEFKKQKYVDPATGKMNFRWNPLSADEDFFISKRKGERAVDIDVLSGLDNQQPEDTNYFREKLFSALGIPKSYLGADETIGRANLGQMDVRFAKSVMRLQRCLKNGINHIIRVDLASRNIDPDRVKYNLKMVIPSGALEIAHVEVKRAEAELAQMYQGLNFPEYYIWSNVLGLNDEEIKDIWQQRAKEQEVVGSELGSEPTPESITRYVNRKLEEQKRQTESMSEARLTSKLKEDIERNNKKLDNRLRQLQGLCFELKAAMRGIQNERVA